jgi:calcineurin-like phosphoesterase family protein
MLIDDKHGLGCLLRLNGNIKLIQGNHDSQARWEKYAQLHNVELLGLAASLKYNKYIFYLSHYPTITSNFDIDKPLNRRVINLCGHSHTDNPWQDFDKGLIYHVELDAHNCYPVLLDEVIEEIKSQIHNSTLKKE